MEKSKSFNRERFIHDYELTRDEYFLLPLEERMEYVKRKYSFILDEIPSIGDIKAIRGTFPFQFNEFFERNGCRVVNFENYDFNIEETEIRRLENVKLEYSEEASKNLDDYIKLVAGAKADMFKSVLVGIYQAKIAALNSENTIPLAPIDEEKILETICSTEFYSTDLPEEIKEYIMLCQLSSVIERIEKLGFADISFRLSSAYFDYLKNHGYECQKEHKLIKVQNKNVEKKLK